MVAVALDARAASPWRGRGADPHVRYMELCRLFGVRASLRFVDGWINGEFVKRLRVVCACAASPGKYWAVEADGFLVLVDAGGVR